MQARAVASAREPEPAAAARPTTSRARSGRSGRRAPPRPSAIIGAMASLSRDDVEHVALLARLGLGEAEIGRLQLELNHILEQYARLAELDTEAIAPTAQTIEVENVLRDDEPRPSLPATAVLDNAPETRDGRIVVPAIIGGD